MSASPQTYLKIFALKSVDPSYNNVSYYKESVDLESVLTTEAKYVKIFTNLQYIRHNGIVDIPVSYDECTKNGYNYCCYDNYEGNNKEFAFITKIEFLNFECTRIYLQFDVWLNSYRNINKTAFIERTHSKSIIKVSDLNYSADVTSRYTTTESYTDFYFCIHVNYVTADKTESPKISQNLFCNDDKQFYIDFIYKFSSGKISSYGNSTALNEVISWSYLSPCISLSFYYVPQSMLSLFKSISASIRVGTDGYTANGYYINNEINKQSYQRTITFNISSDKLAIYPYTSIELFASDKSIIINPTNITNKQVNVLSYVYEDPTGVYFRHEFVSGSNSIGVIYEEASKFPLVRDSYEQFKVYNSDYYEKQLVSFLQSVALGIMGTVTVSATGGMALPAIAAIAPTMTGIAHGTSGIINAALTEQEKINAPESIIPVSGSQTSMLTTFPNSFWYKVKTLNDDYKNICMSIWNVTGQKLNKVSNINYTVGKYYTYVKTIGYMPNYGEPEVREKLSNIFDKGLTIWNKSISNDYKEYGEYVSNSENLS